MASAARDCRRPTACRCRRSRRRRCAAHARPRSSSSRSACRLCHVAHRHAAFAPSRRVRGERLGPFFQNVRLHPGEKRIAVARDRVPGLVEGIVALVVAVRIGRIARRPARTRSRRSSRPAGSRRSGCAARNRRRSPRPSRSSASPPARLPSARPTMPSSSTLPARSALSAWMIGDVRPDRRHRGELFAGERAGDAPDVRVDLGQVGADVAAEDRERQPGRARLVGIGHRGVGVLLDRDLVAASRSHRRRGSGAASRRRDCHPMKIRPCRRSPCRSSGRRRCPASCGSG